MPLYMLTQVVDEDSLKFTDRQHLKRAEQAEVFHYGG